MKRYWFHEAPVDVSRPWVYHTKWYKDKETFAKLMSGLLAYAVLDENGWHEKGDRPMSD